MSNRTVLPPKPPDRPNLLELYALLDEKTTTLTGPNDERMELPPEIFEVLRDVIKAMADGKAITLAPVSQRLTTQEAANSLGIDRPALIKLLESEKIPFQKPSRHRRVLLSDLLEYREKRLHERQEALDRMVEISQEAGLYELCPTPEKTR